MTVDTNARSSRAIASAATARTSGASHTTERPARILPVIVISQFAGTSLWFVGNAVLPNLQQQAGLESDALGHMTSAVQLGFILGTLTFAFFAISDRFAPRRVFFLCSLLGAVANLGIAAFAHSYTALLASRFLTGFFIAGIYPVGMRIAASWYQRDLGNAIGLLVGALVLGTAFPHLLKSLGQTLPWQSVTFAVSGIAVLGGLLMYVLVPEGPYLAKRAKFNPRALAAIFSSRAFRASACGYFGHMWELYAFWAFVPVVLAAHVAKDGAAAFDVSFWTFCVIAAGSIGCAWGGVISVRTGSARVAYAQLVASGICCLVSPLLFHVPTPVFLAFMLFWGIVVVGDSPQFSTLNAHNAPPQLVGSALTIANCIGFSITIASIQLLNYLSTFISPAYLYSALTIGPIFGLIAMRPLFGAERPRGLASD